MQNRLPDFIDPISFAEKRRILTGTIKTSELIRLSELLIDNNGEVAIDIVFEKVGRLATVQGSIKTDLVLECQTCMKGVLYNVNSIINLAVVASSEQIERLAEEFDPLWMEAETISLKKMIEDEILLALPDFPRHAEDCMDYDQSNAKLPVTENNIEQLKSDNPFAALAKLKKTGD